MRVSVGEKTAPLVGPPGTDSHAARASLLGLGCAVPTQRSAQEEITAGMAQVWGLEGEAMNRWRRIVRGAAIDHRHTVMPIEDVARLTTRQRMEAYERLAPPLAAEAAQIALAGSGVEAAEITDLIIVSCTGFASPGVDCALVERLGLRADVRRSIIGFMGCFGAVTGLRAAVGACCADRNARALVVCVELCSLHFRPDTDVENQVASALFADGAAAAVLAAPGPGDGGDGGDEGRSMGEVTVGRSLLIPEGRDWMTWRITDQGFAMTLSREVPVALRNRIASFVDEVIGSRDCTLVVHPGGPGILAAVDGALSLAGGRGIDAARDVLRRYGNLSSSTLLFVLREAMEAGYGAPELLMAFGPGLTIESILIESGKTSSLP